MRLLPAVLCLLPILCVGQIKSPVITDITKAVYKTIQVGSKPDFLATANDMAWVVDDHQGQILKISPDHNKPLLTVDVPEACTAPVVGFGAVWIMSCTEKKLYRIDHRTGKVLAVINTGIADPGGEMSLSVSNGSVWLLSDSSGILTRINPMTNTVQQNIRVLSHSYCTAAGNGAVWITNHKNNSVQRIDPVTNQVTHTIPVGTAPHFLTVGKQAVWTLNQGDGTVSRVDPARNKVVATINVKAKGSGGDIMADGDKIWVVSTNPERPVQIINALTNTVSAIYLQHSPAGGNGKVDGAVRVSEHYVWVSGYHSKTVWIFKR